MPELMLDLSQFTSLDDALSKIEPRDRYLEIGRPLVPVSAGMPMTMPYMFWTSMLARSQGLHEAIAREARMANAHAVFPLLRSFVEAVALVIYVLDHPDYVDVLTVRPSEIAPGGRRRKSPQALIAYASKQAPGMKDVYAELSEATHFGAIAMWASWSIAEEEEGSRRVLWSNEPRWRSEQQALIACAQTLELADAMIVYLGQFRDRHILPTFKIEQ